MTEVGPQVVGIGAGIMTRLGLVYGFEPMVLVGDWV